ncbi:MAG: CHAT domain-containing protein, partial [Gammaproteobacteria bacterium]|nr:CHAT domain-containing protein [Gammaproteobacteria bacterium]
MEHTLIIRHLGDQNGEPEFNVVRQADAKTGAAVTLTPPECTVVKSRPNSDLMQDLRWYLERFLGYPFDPNTQLAQRVLAALKGWGEQSFTQLFQGQALLWYDQARQDGLTTLHLKIASDDPRILAWPWEALRDPQGTTLAQTCRIERQLGELHDPMPLPETLARDRIHILLIIARPYGETDVGYHALSRPMVELIRRERLPVHIDVLRPPTFTQLRRVLHEKPGVYHIVHFDGHGGYGGAGHLGTPYSFEAPQGRLIFEDEQGEDFPVAAEKLSELLTEYRIPIMVLNACQSARIDERAKDPFASVAAALLKAGIRSVVAMGYNLYVSGA